MHVIARLAEKAPRTMEEKTPQRKALQRESKALMFQGAGERTARRARDEQNAQWNLGKPANPQGRRAHTPPAPPEQTSATADLRSGTDVRAGAASSTIDADSEICGNAALGDGSYKSTKGDS